MRFRKVWRHCCHSHCMSGSNPFSCKGKDHCTDDLQFDRFKVNNLEHFGSHVPLVKTHWALCLATSFKALPCKKRKQNSYFLLLCNCVDYSLGRYSSSKVLPIDSTTRVISLVILYAIKRLNLTWSNWTPSSTVPHCP